MSPRDDIDHILDHTAGLWPDLRGERLFITGGTGFFGRWVLETLLRANARFHVGVSAVVLTRDPAAFRRLAPALVDPAVTLLAGDLASFDGPDGAFSHVLHMGTTSSDATFRREPPLDTYATIVQGTERTLEFAVRCRARKVLLTSSGAVYGPQPADLERIPEDFLAAPDVTDTARAVGHAKRAAEFLAVAYGQRHGFDATIARCFAFVGRHLPLDLHYAIGNFIQDAVAGGPIEVRGDGRAQRSYLYAADLAIWLLTILCRGASGRAYNVGSEEAVTMADLAHRVARVASRSVDVVISGRPPVLPRPDRYVPSTRRAQEELGLRQTIGLDDALARTFRDVALTSVDR